ncbi:MAG: MarR family winged helix-turn-helix transcriptional regulator [Hyphomicrobiaceae bacterium]
MEASFLTIRRAAQCADSLLATELVGTSLTPRSYILLETVSELETPCQSDIVHLTGIDRSTVAHIAERLEKRGLIERSVDDDDVRRKIVRITPQGRAMIVGLTEARLRAEEKLFFAVDDVERVAFLHVLRVLVNALGPIKTATVPVLPRLKRAVRSPPHG